MHYPIYTITQDIQNRVLELRRRKEKSLDSNNLFFGEYECSSLVLDKEKKIDEKEEIGSLETRSNNVEKGEVGGHGLVGCESEVMKEIEDYLLEEVRVTYFEKKKFGGGFEQDIDDEGEEDKEDEEGDGKV
ncbi:hypothetical protein Tco_0896078 [Tanacetum coccineum]